MNLLLDFYFLKSKHESILNILGNIELKFNEFGAGYSISCN